MGLCILKVVGPLNELMTTVRVQNAVPGATIVVSARGPNPRELGQGTAAGGEDVVTLNPGEKLAAADRVIAVQNMAGDFSPAVPAQLEVPVAPGPASASDLGYIGSQSHLYVCGQALWLTGVVPGATAEVSWGGSVHGQAVAGPDGARVVLDAGLPPSGVRIRQTAPVGAGPDATLHPDAAVLGEDRILPAPKVGAPLLACQSAVLVSDVFDGAQVQLTHQDGHVESAFFDMPALWLRVAALQQPDEVRAKKRFPGCQIDGADSSPPVPVGPAAKVPAPVVGDQLCRGAVTVRVAGLVPGSVVVLEVPGASYTGMAPPNTDYHDFYVAPLTPGPVRAAQMLCGFMSGNSKSVTVHDNPPVTTGVNLVAPLMECGRAVHVTNAHPGALLLVLARRGNQDFPISDFFVADLDKATIPVTDYLHKDDDIRVVQYGCSDQGFDSNVVKVLSHSAPPSPTLVEPVYAGQSQVSVKDVIPGALVEVYTGRGDTYTLAGSAIATSSPATVNLSVTLHLDSLVRARQTLCGTVTEPGHPAPVVAPPPQVPQITNPAHGATGVPKRPVFSWTDPGAGGPGNATSYELQVLSGSTTVIPVTAAGTTSFSPGSDLPSTQLLTLKVRGKNPSGASDWATVTFTTQATPVAPVLLAYNVATRTLTGKDFLPGKPVWVRLSMIGNTVWNSYGSSVPDTRDVTRTFTSNTAGDLSAVFDFDHELPLLVVVDGYEVLHGAQSGEIMHFSAHDERSNPAEFLGKVWSNTLSVKAP